MKPTAVYSSMLYRLADEIRSEEGCVTESAEHVEEAAERLDTLTVTITGLKLLAAEMLVALRTVKTAYEAQPQKTRTGNICLVGKIGQIIDVVEKAEKALA